MIKLVSIPLKLAGAALAVVFLISNRQKVAVSFDPFSAETPALATPPMELWIVIAAAMMLVLQTLELEGQPLSGLWHPLRRYYQTGEVNRRVEDVAGVIDRVREHFGDGEADDLDGLTVSYPGWWFNLRPSNTEPLLRLNVEGPTREETLSHQDRILAVIDS